MLVRALFRIDPGRLVLALLLGLVGGSAYAVALWWMESALDGRLPPPAGGQLLWPVVAVGLLQYSATTHAARLLLMQLTQLRQRLVEDVLAAPLARVESIGTQALVSRLVDDVQRLAEGVWALPGALLQAGVCVAAYAYMGWQSPAGLLLLLLSQVVLFGGLAWLMGRFGQRTELAARDRQCVIDHHMLLGQQLHGLTQSGRLREAFLQTLLRPALVRCQRSALDVSRSAALMDALTKVGFLLIIALLLRGGGGGVQMDLASRMPVLLAFMFVVAPFSSLLNSVQVLNEADRAWRRLHALALGPANVPVPLQTLPPLRSVSLDQVSFSYANPVLAGVSVRWDAGQILLLQGGNGSGKTTLARLMCGLYLPDSGLILHNGTPLAAADVPAFREQVAALWNGSDPTMVWLDPRQYALSQAWWRRFELDAFLPCRAGWLDVRALSSGQRSRASLVALLSLGCRFIVLDEWAAYQDAAFRQVFYRDLLPTLRGAGYGVLLIAHDVEAEAVADEVFVVQRPLPPVHAVDLVNGGDA